MHTLSPIQPEPDFNEYANRFSDLVQQGKDAWINAGKIIAEASEKIPGFIKKLVEVRPEFTERFLRKMIDLGNGSLHPKLLIGESPGELRLRRLPYSWQEKYVDSPIALLVKTDTGLDELLVSVRNLEPEQCNQVFGDGFIRDIAQQRAYLENKWASKAVAPVKSNLPYRIIKDELVVSVPTKFTKKELARILSDMES